MSRLLLGLVAPALVSGGIAWLLPTSPDALGRTLLMAPWAAAALTGLARLLRVRAAPGWMRAAAVGWGAAAVSAHLWWLGEGTDRALFALYLVGLVVFSVRLIPALARRFAAAGRWATAPAFALALTLGGACLPWMDAVAEPNGDEPYYLLLSESLARDGDLDLRNQYEEGVARRFTAREIEPQSGDPTGAAGQQWSRHLWFLPLMLVPFWLAGGTLGARFAMLLMWAFLGERILRLLLTQGLSPRAAVRAWLAVAFSSPLLLYASTIWVEVPAALLVTLAMLYGRRHDGKATWRGDLLAAGSLALLPLLKLRMLLIALPLGVAIFAGRGARWRRAWLPLAALGLGAIAVVVVNRLTIGRALGIYAGQHLLTVDKGWGEVPLRLLGLFADPAFGLMGLGPIWILAASGVGRAVRRSRLGAATLAASLPYLLAVAARGEWYGGWSPPFRYGIVLLPMLALPLGFAFDRRPGARERTLRWALTCASVAIALALVVVPGWGTSLAIGRTHLVDVVSAQFHADFARFLPSAVRPRLATWLTPAAIAALLLFALAGRRRARRAPAPRAVAWLLAAAALWTVAAHAVPTRRVEVEDRWVHKQGGALYPSRWIVNRTRFRSGWVLPRGASLELEPVAGSSRARVSARLRLGSDDMSAARVAVSCDGERIAEWLVAKTTWHDTEPREFDWCAGGRVRLTAEAEHPGRRPIWIVVDSLGFEWR